MGKLANFKFYLVPMALLLGLALIAGCSNSTSNQKAVGETMQAKSKEAPVEVNVWAAASLKDVLTKLAPNFEKVNNAKLVFNFGSSGDLQVQIEQGGPADLFISAGKSEIDALGKEKLIDSASRTNLLSNDLVIAVPANSKLTISKIEEIATINGVNKIAIGEPSQVPAGKYAQQSLEKANIWNAVQPKLVLAEDVRQVLSYVETGEVALGFVYKSDMKVSKNAKIAYSVPDSYHDTIVYPAAVVKNGRQHVLAAKLLDYLKSKAALNVFKEYGFKQVAK